jgi:hypothetical protein
MNNTSKLILSDEELQLLNNSGWILTKRIIIDKVYRLFGGLADTIKGSMAGEDAWLPPEVLLSSPKISRGENYLQLPYVLLDYPRCFSGDDIFAIRTFFWWGNFFSMTLHLSGRYKKQFAEKIYSNREILLQNDFYVCINEDQWQHHFEENNYQVIKHLSGEELFRIMKQKEFVKLAVIFSFRQWKGMDELLEKSVADMMKLMKA